MNHETTFACVPDEQVTCQPTDACVPARDAGKLSVRWASCEQDVRDAQRLRYRVFAGEMGACLSPPAGTAPRLDADGFDPFCDHLLVSAGAGDSQDRGPLVGTYRVLPPHAARRAGGLYIDTEFDLTPLFSLRGRAVELGRSCVHPGWRSGAVIMTLWTALAHYMLEHRLDTMIGCASVGLGDGGQAVGNLWGRLQHTHLVAPQWQVQPRVAWPLADAYEPFTGRYGPTGVVATPPLIKGYLRCGARLLGPPALDADFNTADLPMMLRIGELAPRYRQHFLGL